MNVEKARFNMIEQQIKPWKVLDDKLLGAMATLPREMFVPDGHKNLAYADISVPLAHNQMMHTPREIARMIQALELDGSEKVLEIGCGSGYSSAVLAKLAKKVFSVDIIPEFIEQAQKVLTQLAIDNVNLEEADAAEGWLVHALYDAILVTSALSELPDALKRSLNPGGKIVAVIGSAGQYQCQVFHLDDENSWHHHVLFPIVAKPMINAEEPNQFEF